VRKPIVVVAAVAGSLAVGGGPQAAVTTLHVGDRVLLSGTTLGCNVSMFGGRPTAVCVKAISGGVVKGSYGIVVSDRAVIAARFTDSRGGNVEVYTRAQPALDGPPLPSAKASKQIYRMRLGDVIRVAGTHLAVAAERNPKGDATLGVFVASRSFAPVPGTLAGGISSRDVAILQVTKSGASTVLFTRKHAK